MFNVMAGFSRREDKLPARFHKEFLKTGPPKGKSMPQEAFEKALAEYYALRGWDTRGRPTVEKLEELGIEETITEYKKELNHAG